VSSTSKSKDVWGTKTSTNKATTKSKTPVVKKTTSKKSVYTPKKSTTFKTKSSAKADFKKKSASKYTSTYATKPTTRPSYIPNTYSTGGTSYNINYNSRYGGYGYMHLGTWMMYDMMSDAIMMDTMMRNDGYAYDGMPGYTPRVRRSTNIFDVVIWLVVFGIIGGVVVLIIKKN